jgi:hypothetical protein
MHFLVVRSSANFWQFVRLAQTLQLPHFPLCQLTRKALFLFTFLYFVNKYKYKYILYVQVCTPQGNVIYSVVCFTKGYFLKNQLTRNPLIFIDCSSGEFSAILVCGD